MAVTETDSFGRFVGSVVEIVRITVVALPKRNTIAPHCGQFERRIFLAVIADNSPVHGISGSLLRASLEKWRVGIIHRTQVNAWIE